MSLRINYERRGEGPPLLLLHGVGHHWQAWRPIIERLEPEFDVIAADSPGFGRSAPLSPGIEPSIVAYADAFEWFLAELGIHRPHVAGNSMGGGIALELGRRHAVASVTAFSPVGFWTPAEVAFCRSSLSLLGSTPPRLRPLLERLAATRAGRLVLFSQICGYPSRLPVEEAVGTLRDAWTAPALKGALEAFSGYRFRNGEELGGIPVTIAWGRRDALLLYPLQAPRARAALPDAEHLTLGAGHVPFSDDPAAVASAIRDHAARAAGVLAAS